jgi:membrane peptidoglycan carboxypeptidase
VIPAEIARQINQVLADRPNRMVSLTGITDTIGRTVAIKTGTTNDYRDVWTLGYTPNLVVGAWAGNNDNHPMNDAISALIITPVWGSFMSQVAKNFPPEDFKAPQPVPTDIKPVFRGIWQGGVSYFTDTVSGKVATQYTPNETKKEVVFPSVHSILQWVDKNDPRGPIPAHPEQDSQYANWEYATRKWFDQWKLNNPTFKETTNFTAPTATDDVHTPDKMPHATITSPAADSVINPSKLLTITLQETGVYPIQKSELYLNGKYVLTNTSNPLTISFVPSDIGGLSSNNTITVNLYDSVFNQTQVTLDFTTQ